MQTSMSEFPANAFAGLMADSGFRDVLSTLAATRQLEQVVVDTATASDTYQIIINGTVFEYTSDGTPTVTEIRDGLKALIDAGSEPVSTESVSTDTLLIESTDHDAGFTIALGGNRAADMTLTNLVGQEDAIPFGVVVVEDERVTVDANTGKVQGCRLPRLATDITDPSKIMGASIADTSKVTRTSAPFGGYSAGEAVPALKKGRLWMATEDVANVVKGAPVYVRHVATGSEQLGAVRPTDDGGDTDPVPFGAAVFTGQVIAADNLAVVEWNLP
jgi:hypothetical protein